MPNLKIYVDDTLWAERRTALVAVLGPLRTMLCERLGVGMPACQLVLQPVTGLPDQPLVNAEIFVLPRPERTRDFLEAVCGTLRDSLSEACGGVAIAVRCTTLDPLGYLAIK